MVNIERKESSEISFRVKPRFVTIGGSFGEMVAILAPNAEGAYALEDVGGRELLSRPDQPSMPIDNSGLSGLARTLTEGVERKLIDKGDQIPVVLMPELGIALVSAVGEDEKIPYFVKLQTSRRIARAEAPGANPLF